jgi:hypothetical protein
MLYNGRLVWLCAVSKVSSEAQCSIVQILRLRAFGNIPEERRNERNVLELSSGIQSNASDDNGGNAVATCGGLDGLKGKKESCSYQDTIPGRESVNHSSGERPHCHSGQSQQSKESDDKSKFRLELR